MNDLSNYEKLKKDSQDFYSSTGRIFSPALETEISFNSEGFNHIIFKKGRSERERSSQILRFKLLPLAIKLVKKSTTYQEYEETISTISAKKYKKKAFITRPIKYWGIIAIIDGRKIKVILRKIGDNGNIHFWSVVPAWTTNKYRDVKFFTTMKGNPEED